MLPPAHVPVEAPRSRSGLIHSFVAAFASPGAVGSDPARVLREVADLLALGADPIDAWAPALAHAETAALARGARRTARSGAALAELARAMAADARARTIDRAEARAQRVMVLASAPLALCFLPAFLCLGVVPVVVGMATSLSAIL